MLIKYYFNSSIYWSRNLGWLYFY